MIEAVKTESDRYEAAFEALARERRSGEPEWMATRRREAFAEFQSVGLPSSRLEDWKHTDLKAVAGTAFERAATAALPEDADSPFAGLSGPRLVFVNGQLRSTELDGLPAEGLRVQDLRSALRDGDPLLEQHLGQYAGRAEQAALASLNLALTEDGAVIHVQRGIVVEEPLQLVFWNTPGERPWMAHPRVLIVAEDNAQLTVIETHLGTAPEATYLSTAVTEIVAGDSTVVDHYKLQQESEGAYHLGTVEIEQGRSSNVRNTIVTLGGTLTRNETGTRLNGEGGWCDLEGLYVVTGQQHVDNFTRLQHARPHCDSRERYKGLLDDRARAVFRGRIIVDKGAQKTDSKQTNNNLILSDSARVNTKPQLEIYADDVKCTHGATIGQLEPDAIFYLRSRGIDEAAARSLLIYAFANEIAERVQVARLRTELEEYLFNWLPRGELVREAV